MTHLSESPKEPQRSSDDVKLGLVVWIHDAVHDHELPGYLLSRVVVILASAAILRGLWTLGNQILAALRAGC